MADIPSVLYNFFNKVSSCSWMSVDCQRVEMMLHSVVVPLCVPSVYCGASSAVPMVAHGEEAEWTGLVQCRFSRPCPEGADALVTEEDVTPRCQGAGRSRPLRSHSDAQVPGATQEIEALGMGVLCDPGVCPEAI